MIMRDLTGKISTYPQVKIALKKFAKKRECFTTQEAIASLIERSGRVFVSSNKIAQYLRGIESHEYNDRLKKWTKRKK